MIKMFCPYCGTKVYDGCCCAAEAESEARDFYEEYHSNPLVTAGWAQQDQIDLWRAER